MIMAAMRFQPVANTPSDGQGDPQDSAAVTGFFTLIH